MRPRRTSPIPETVLKQAQQDAERLLDQHGSPPDIAFFFKFNSNILESDRQLVRDFAEKYIDSWFPGSQRYEIQTYNDVPSRVEKIFAWRGIVDSVAKVARRRQSALEQLNLLGSTASVAVCLSTFEINRLFASAYDRMPKSFDENGNPSKDGRIKLALAPDVYVQGLNLLVTEFHFRCDDGIGTTIVDVRFPEELVPANGEIIAVEGPAEVEVYESLENAGLFMTVARYALHMMLSSLGTAISWVRNTMNGNPEETVSTSTIVAAEQRKSPGTIVASLYPDDVLFSAPRKKACFSYDRGRVYAQQFIGPSTRLNITIGSDGLFFAGDLMIRD